jgi:hypothetical protein
LGDEYDKDDEGEICDDVDPSSQRTVGCVPQKLVKIPVFCQQRGKPWYVTGVMTQDKLAIPTEHHDNNEWKPPNSDSSEDDFVRREKQFSEGSKTNSNDESR